MPRNFSWIEEGVLAGMARPFGSPNEFQELREQGVRAIVSLTESPLNRAVIEEFGFEYKHLPVADFTPPTLEQIRQFVAFVQRMRRAGKPVAAHCGAGQGRTGAMLACYLVSRGMSADDAIAEVRRKRPGSVETQEQEDRVREYEREVRRGRQTKKKTAKKSTKTKRKKTRKKKKK